MNSADLSINRALHPLYCLLCSSPWLPIQAVTGVKMYVREEPSTRMTAVESLGPSNSCLLPRRTLKPREVAQFKPKRPQLTLGINGQELFSPFLAVCTNAAEVTGLGVWGPH